MPGSTGWDRREDEHEKPRLPVVWHVSKSYPQACGVKSGLDSELSTENSL